MNNFGVNKVLAAAVLAGVMAFAAMPAMASSFVWKDEKNDFTMSFPDTWRMQTEDSPLTQLRIVGPLAEDLANCRMQVKDDGRIKIYPKRLVDEAVVGTLDRTFWDDYINEHNNAQIAEYLAPASLGNMGDATAVKVAYVENGERMYGVMIASLYADKLYVASCASKYDVYERWAPVFASILDSVQLKSKYHPFANGYYRDFLSDPKLVLPRVKPGTTDKNSFSFHTSEWFNPAEWFRFNKTSKIQN